jgi:hypothetical protein
VVEGGAAPPRAARDLGRDGERRRPPRRRPVWFWWDGAVVYFTTKADSRKARNIGEGPAVVLHNGDGADPIVLKGDAAVAGDAAELERVDRAYAEKYVDPGSGARATIFVEGDVVFRVRPRFVSTWEYATCANRTDWRFESVCACR